MDYNPNYVSGYLGVNNNHLFSSPEEAFKDYIDKKIKETEENLKQSIQNAKNRLKKAIQKSNKYYQTPKVVEKMFEITN